MIDLIIHAYYGKNTENEQFDVSSALVLRIIIFKRPNSETLFYKGTLNSRYNSADEKINADVKSENDLCIKKVKSKFIILYESVQ